MSGSNALPPIDIRVDGAQAAQQAIDGMTAAADRMAAANVRSASQLGALRTQAESTTGATRNLGQMIGQAGYQVQDFAVQVASGQSALTAFVQQGSQLAGIFGPAGILAGAALAIGGVAAQFLLAGDNAETMRRRAEAAFKGMSDAATQTRDLLAEVNALFLSANQNAANAANRALATTREGLLRQQDIAVQMQEGAVVELGPARQALREAEARASAELRRRLESTEGRLAFAQGRGAEFIRPFEEQMRQDLFRPSERVLGLEYEITRHGTRSGQIAEALQRLSRFGTYDADLPEPPAPPADGGYGRGGTSASRDTREFGPLDGSPQSLARLEHGRQRSIETEARERERREAENTRALERQEDQNRRVTDRIVDYGANAFADMFEENGKGWEGMLDTFESTFTKLIARLAAEAIIRPIVEPIVSGLGLGSLGTGNGGLAGIFGGAATTATSGEAGTGGVGSLLGAVSGSRRSSGGGLLSGVGSVLNGPVWTSGGGWFSPGAVAAPSISGMSAADAMASLPATPTTATTGYGAIGSSSVGAYAAGIGGGYMAGSTLGGYVAGGSPARQQNAQIGAAGGAVAGAVIGSIIPGIGTVVGGLIGGAIGGAGGGLIGPGKGFAGGDVGVAVDANGYLTIGHVGGKRWDSGAAANQTTAGLSSINDVLRGAGISIGGLGGTQLGYQGYGGSAHQFGPTEIWRSVHGSLSSSNQTVNTALRQPWMQSFEDLSVIAPYAAQNDNLTRALGSGGIRSRDDFNSASTFISQIYEPLVKAAQSTDTFAEAIAAQNKVYDDAIAKARELGLAETSLASARDKSLTEALNARNTAVSNTLAGLTIEELTRAGKPVEAGLVAYNVGASQRRTQLSDFLTQNGYGTDTGLYQTSMERLSALVAAGRKDTLASLRAENAPATNDGAGKSLLEDLTIGGLGGLTSAARYAAGLKNYQAARASGDLDRISAAARSLTPVARDHLGTSERFGGLVADISRDVRRAGGDPVGLGVFLEGQAAGNQALERIYGLSNVQVAELKGMRAEISRLNAVITTLIQRKVAA